MYPMKPTLKAMPLRGQKVSSFSWPNCVAQWINMVMCLWRPQQIIGVNEEPEPGLGKAEPIHHYAVTLQGDISHLPHTSPSSECLGSTSWTPALTDETWLPHTAAFLMPREPSRLWSEAKQTRKISGISESWKGWGNRPPRHSKQLAKHSSRRQKAEDTQDQKYPERFQLVFSASIDITYYARCHSALGSHPSPSGLGSIFILSGRPRWMSIVPVQQGWTL